MNGVVDTTTLSVEMHTLSIHTGNPLSISDFDNQNPVVLDQVLDVIQFQIFYDISTYIFISVIAFMSCGKSSMA